MSLQSVYLIKNIYAEYVEGSQGFNITLCDGQSHFIGFELTKDKLLGEEEYGYSIAESPCDCFSDQEAKILQGQREYFWFTGKIPTMQQFQQFLHRELPGSAHRGNAEEFQVKISEIHWCADLRTRWAIVHFTSPQFKF